MPNDPTPETFRKLTGMIRGHIARTEAGIVPAKRVPTKRCRLCGTHFAFQVLKFPGEPRQAVCVECQSRLDGGESCIVDKGQQDPENCVIWIRPADPALAGQIEFLPTTEFLQCKAAVNRPKD